MVRVLVLKRLYNLSDEQMEYQVLDRMVPCCTTWAKACVPSLTTWQSLARLRPAH